MVRVFSQPGCMPCKATIRKFERVGVAFTLVDITSDPAAVDELKARSFASTPAVIATVGGKEYAWSGHRPDDIEALAFLIKEAA